MCIVRQTQADKRRRVTHRNSILHLPTDKLVYASLVDWMLDVEDYKHEERLESNNLPFGIQRHIDNTCYSPYIPSLRAEQPRNVKIGSSHYNHVSCVSRSIPSQHAKVNGTGQGTQTNTVATNLQISSNQAAVDIPLSPNFVESTQWESQDLPFADETDLMLGYSDLFEEQFFPPLPERFSASLFPSDVCGDDIFNVY